LFFFVCPKEKQKENWLLLFLFIMNKKIKETKLDFVALQKVHSVFATPLFSAMRLKNPMSFKDSNFQKI
jgi:hypothetical protein